jgi:hypothetical protein
VRHLKDTGLTQFVIFLTTKETRLRMKVIEESKKFLTDANRKDSRLNFSKPPNCIKITLRGIKDCVYGKQKLMVRIHGRSYIQTHRKEEYRVSLL